MEEVKTDKTLTSLEMFEGVVNVLSRKYDHRDISLEPPATTRIYSIPEAPVYGCSAVFHQMSAFPFPCEQLWVMGAGEVTKGSYNPCYEATLVALRFKKGSEPTRDQIHEAMNTPASELEDCYFLLDVNNKGGFTGCNNEPSKRLQKIAREVVDAENAGRAATDPGIYTPKMVETLADCVERIFSKHSKVHRTFYGTD